MADMLDLYNECRSRGLNVKGLSGWTSWQSGYWFRREDEWSGSGRQSNPPTFFIDHHTATTAYTPNVKNSKGQSKANIWLGLSRPGTSRYYSTGSGEAQAAFAVRWAANYGNGACIRDVYRRYVWRDLVVPGPARSWTSASDNGYANKLGIGMEVVHPGDGSALDPDVFELMCQINAAAEDVFGWKKNQSRIIGHEDSTRRKIDPRYAQGAPYTMAAIRERVAAIHGGTTPPGGDDVKIWPPFNKGDGLGDLFYLKAAVAWLQNELNNAGAQLTLDGLYGDDTAKAVDAYFAKNTVGGTVVNGNNWSILIRSNHVQGGTTPPPPGDVPDHKHSGTPTGDVIR